VNNHGGPAVAFVGATASGKSALAHGLARELGDLEILCVDAMTVYRGMDIGTAKPTAQEQKEVSYHLLDLVEPSDEFTVAAFQAAARDAADLVWRLGGAVAYVGGTGLYGRAVLDNLTIPGQYPAIRAALEAEAVEGLAGLYAELVEKDPVAAARMEPTNARRVVRALEVIRGGGRPFSSYGDGLRSYPPVRVIQIGVRVERDELDRRIEERFRSWMEQGLLDEVAGLAARPGGLSRTARQAVGYKELLAHIEEGADLDDCVLTAITHSRQLARRQRSWFERDPRVEWFATPSEAADRARAVLASPDGFVRD